MIARPHALVLDAGNTLVFLDHVAVAEAARLGGVHVTASAIAAAEPAAKRRYEAALVAGTDHEHGWTLHMRALFESAGLSSSDASTATEAARSEHARFNLWRRVPAGLHDHLGRARAAGLALGVVSNSEGHLAELFERLDLTRFFEVVVDSGIEGVRKPDPAIFRLGLTRMGVQAHDAVYAGDIPAVDIDGARAVGMAAVLIDTLDHYPEYRGAPRFRAVSALLEAWQIP